MQEQWIKNSSNICFGYLLQCYNHLIFPKHIFCKEIRIRHACIFYPLRVLYNSKFILMATSLGITAVVVARVHCTNYHHCSLYGSLEMNLNIRVKVKVDTNVDRLMHICTYG